MTPALAINPNFAKADLKLELNTITGDVYVLANASVGFAGYTVADPSAHLLGGSTSPDPAKLLSVSSANGGNSNVYGLRVSLLSSEIKGVNTQGRSLSGIALV